MGGSSWYIACRTRSSRNEKAAPASGSSSMNPEAAASSSRSSTSSTSASSTAASVAASNSVPTTAATLSSFAKRGDRRANRQRTTSAIESGAPSSSRSATQRSPGPPSSGADSSTRRTSSWRKYGLPPLHSCSSASERGARFVVDAPSDERPGRLGAEATELDLLEPGRAAQLGQGAREVVDAADRRRLVGQHDRQGRGRAASGPGAGP